MRTIHIEKAPLVHDKSLSSDEINRQIEEYCRKGGEIKSYKQGESAHGITKLTDREKTIFKGCAEGGGGLRVKDVAIMAGVSPSKVLRDTIRGELNFYKHKNAKYVTKKDAKAYSEMILKEKQNSQKGF